MSHVSTGHRALIQVLNLAMPFFGLIALGFFTARFKASRGTPIPESGLGWMNFFLIYIALPALFFRGKLGDLMVRNANMADFTGLLQSVVLDKPVLDQTELTGRWDFMLKWTPDDSQFSGMGAKIPPATDAADAPPNLYTAIQEQIGLKLDATKAPADVLVVDHVEKPSDN